MSASYKRSRFLFLIAAILVLVGLTYGANSAIVAPVLAQAATAEVTAPPPNETEPAPEGTDTPVDPTETATAAPADDYVDPVFGCNMLFGYPGAMPWIANESGTPIEGAWAIPNNDGLTWRVTAPIVVNPGTPVNLMITNGLYTIRFRAEKFPVNCAIYWVQPYP